ncbi:Pro-neuregulin-2, membrane-bound isoform [Echinococcus granulosus]|uniref:Pro-neuregulin-2, membrane-bound isoform n=1 Tax=Echinococcus granulosus TaxID=6210 RepID=W6UXH5_ECHGR|nr:Pro-neuregulin-2, membrane-bound isoform [Echinococcus granulosus]EUB58254.1 Pro-neuregulin-2, membrane-bound isoform [Echinococcus granulosus]
MIAIFVLVVLFTPFRCLLDAIEAPKCAPSPKASEIRQYLSTSSIVLHARLQEMIPLKDDQEFDVVILVTQVLAKPAGVNIPPRVALRRFFIPSNKSSSSPSSGSTFDSFHQRFGCLEAFKPNAKYTFLLADTGEIVVQRRIVLPVFALSGPSLTFSEEVTAEILQYLCRTCYSPQVNTFEPQILPFGEDFNATCVANGDPLPHVMWYKDSYPVDIAANGRNVRVEIVQTSSHVREAILEIDNLVLLDNGDYVCKASNPLGSTQSLLQLRVSTAGVSLTDQEIAMESRDLVPCPADENHCFNDGECFAKKSNPLERRCKCKDGFMGDQCQFRTSGIVFSTMSVGNANTIWLQTLLQFAFFGLFGLIVVGIILAFRRKDLRAKNMTSFRWFLHLLAVSQEEIYPAVSALSMCTSAIVVFRLSPSRKLRFQYTQTKRAQPYGNEVTPALEAGSGQQVNRQGLPRLSLRKRKIMLGNEVLLKSQYIQVNTIEPPPPPINSPNPSNLQMPRQKVNFFAPVMPQIPNYTRLDTGELNFNACGDSKAVFKTAGSDLPTTAADLAPRVGRKIYTKLEAWTQSYGAEE